MTIYECMERLGSYGIWRLATLRYGIVETEGWERTDWMAHKAVQNKRLMQLTLPMTHASTSFEIYGIHASDLGKGKAVPAQKQDFDIMQQLRLGVRAFDIEVTWNMNVRRLYGVNKMMTISLYRTML